MTNKEWFYHNKIRAMRQYRSNQGRSPKREKTIFRVLKTAIIVFVLIVLYFVIAG